MRSHLLGQTPNDAPARDRTSCESDGVGRSSRQAVRAALATEFDTNSYVVREPRPGHFVIEVTSAAFEAKSSEECRRLVLDALAPLMAHGVRSVVQRVVSIRTLLPSESSSEDQ